jgi:hypothetical protein
VDRHVVASHDLFFCDKVSVGSPSGLFLFFPARGSRRKRERRKTREEEKEYRIRFSKLDREGVTKKMAK